MKNLLLLSLSLFIFSTSIAQKGISFGIQINSSPTVTDTTLVSSNPNCVTHALKTPNNALFCRFDLTEKIGIKIGVASRTRSYLTTVLTDIGPKSVQWSTNTILVPLGFYYTKTAENGRYYVLFDFDGIVLPKGKKTTSTFEEKQLSFQSNQSTDWGAIVNYTPRFGINVSPRSKIELSMCLDFQFYGQKHIDNNFQVEKWNGNKEFVYDELKNTPTKNFDFTFYYGLSYVYKFPIKVKSKTVETVKE